MIEVERVWNEITTVRAIVAASNEVSAITIYDTHAAKTLLLAGASYFERRVMAAIEEYVELAAGDGAVKYFVMRQGVERKFFSLFDFSASAKNVNEFFGKFGPDFSAWAKGDLAGLGLTKEDQIAFLDFCRLRNNLVHNNYATYSIGKTLDEVWIAFRAALKLSEWIDTAFVRFERRVASATTDAPVQDG